MPYMQAAAVTTHNSLPGFYLRRARWHRDGLIRKGSVVTLYPRPLRFHPAGMPPLPGTLHEGSEVSEVSEVSDVTWWGARVLLEDDMYVVLNKPGGMPCDPVQSNFRSLCLAAIKPMKCTPYKSIKRTMSPCANKGRGAPWGHHGTPCHHI
jgi:hypothetical protein